MSYQQGYGGYGASRGGYGGDQQQRGGYGRGRGGSTGYGERYNPYEQQDYGGSYQQQGYGSSEQQSGGYGGGYGGSEQSGGYGGGYGGSQQQRGGYGGRGRGRGGGRGGGYRGGRGGGRGGGYRGGRGGGFRGGRGRGASHGPGYGASSAETVPSIGTILRVNAKGFGFMKVKGMDEDVFFPAREVLDGKFDDLQEGNQVMCVLGPDPKEPSNWQAKQIRKGCSKGKIDKLMQSGFGFLISDDGERLFFHAKEMDQGAQFDDLTDGARVAFELTIDERKGGFAARGVRMIEEQNHQTE